MMFRPSLMRGIYVTGESHPAKVAAVAPALLGDVEFSDEV
jgi:hypothetical protein